MARNKYPEETVKLILDVSTRLFTEKGYDATSLQDIINDTKLSKGAIYHHFASKEEILEAIFNRIGEENTTALAKIRDDNALNGIEKLRSIFKAALFNSNQSLMLTVTPCLLDNPRFLAMQLRQLYQIVAPKFIKPILQQGIDDKTIQVQNPGELAEAIMVLSNIWLNPLVSMTDETGMRNRCITFNTLLQGMGIELLLDDEMIDGYIGYCKDKKE
ncbi:TPA: TetR/AcrR family transcriptional regulator [Clostridioides difficile]|nr:TetR/AcrR family transcriptional regulator [Clostridioides difficile]HBF1357053.1 TetR/AcrR family transcriptional regulator [Clostridioides difficile]HBF1402480.1 TetR/AcrR family transcriptional regulator [Clostridioides difficile]HBF1456835.1 TetR/AcrR family transcriptional regulator [Clostridioides difficile]HBL6624850.1 TetR/AcrR family transcriptional regulator [Clostridioides difficile]